MKQGYCLAWVGGKEPVVLELDVWIDLDESLLNRLDGPAVEFHDGSKQWWVNGKPHRLDGPALEWSTGFSDWLIDGVVKNGAKIERWIKENDVDITTEEGQMALKLVWV